MTLSPSGHAQEDYIAAPPGRALPIARFISSVAAPPTLAILGVLATAASLEAAHKVVWATIYLLVAVGIPTVYLIWLLKSGQVSDFHLRIRTERTRPMLAAIVSSGLGWAILLLSGAPPVFTTVAFAACLQSILIFLITSRWKISAHSAAAATLAVIGWKVSSPAVAWFFTALVPTIAWARLRLRRHTMGQVVAGSIMGATVLWMAFAIVQNS